MNFFMDIVLHFPKNEVFFNSFAVLGIHNHKV